MDDSKPVEQALNEAGIEVVDQEPDASGELEDDEDKVSHSPKLILVLRRYNNRFYFYWL